MDAWLDIASGRLATGLWIFARFSALLFSAPLLSSRSVPPPVRVGLGGALALVLTPLTPMGPAPDGAVLAVGVVKEVVVGLALGWIATLFFSAVQMAGEWLDLQGGFQAGQLLNPVTETQSAPMGNVTHLLAGIVFLGVGGHGLLLRAAAHSLTISPPGALQLHIGGADDWTTLVTQVVWMAVQLAAPVAAALFLAEVAIGLMNRAMPQVNVMMLTLPAKSLLALAVLALSIPLLARGLVYVFGQMGGQLAGIVRAFGA
jgi:flagellar biosynthetic protein FliR